MIYLLKYYIKSKYFGYSKIYYKEFETYQELMSYCYDKKIKNFDVYIKENYIIEEI